MSTTKLMVNYFDGQTSRPHEVSIWLEQGMLQMSGPHLIRQVPLGQVQWSERTRHGARVAHFADGGTVQALDDGAWDNWVRTQGLGDSLAAKVHQSWRWTWLATSVLLVVAVLGYGWGLPAAARAMAPRVPHAVSMQIGQATLHAMDEQWLRPSQLSARVQSQWRTRLVPFLASIEHPASHKPPSPITFTLHFRQARIGPNAFALPDGSIVVTDALIELLHDREDVLMGVLGHEAGHVVLHHGLRSLIQAGVLGTASSLAFGDFSTILAGAPALLGHLAYSREFEREADEVAIALMRTHHVQPSAMLVLFERLRQYRQQHGETEAGLGIALSSHPADEERMARFRAADLSLGEAQPSSTTSL